MKFAKRMDNFGEGVFTMLAKKRQLLRAAGKRVVDFSIGAPNIPPAPHIINALLQEAAKPENYVYAIADTTELQNAVAQWYSRRYGVVLDGATQVVSLLGSQEGLAHISLACINPGDIVLVPNPGYPIFSGGPLLAGAQLYPVAAKASDDFLMDFATIPPEIAKKAKLMIVSYPNNPVTTIAPSDWYQKLIAFAKANDIMVLHDNAYSELVFDGKTGGSFLSYPGAVDVGVEFNSLSKTYGMAGARIGFAVGNAQIVQKLAQLKSNIDYGLFLPLQKAAIAAITGPQDCVAATCAAYQHRRDLLIDGFAAIGWAIDKPAATMFVWAKIPPKFTDCQAFALELMERTGVIVVPGTAFGTQGQGYVRLALVQGDADIAYAIKAVDESGILK